MATNNELYDLRSDSALQNKVIVACLKKAQIILDDVLSTASQVAWANNCISDPDRMGNKIFYYFLAANSALPVSTIQAATDVTIETDVDKAVAALIAGGITN